jgi:arginyl-tRNA synthetase
MADPLQIVADLLADAFEQVAGRRVDPVVRPSDRADAQANAALALSKELGRPPRELAQEALALAKLDGVATATVEGPGFLNLTFADTFLGELLAGMAADERLGIALATAPATYVIDYSAPNVAKEMHVGHLRSTIIGDALVRLHEFLGHTVLRENHIGDWGRPFGMLIEHLLDLGEAEAANELSVGDLDAFYKQANAKFKDNPEFQDRARQRVVLLQGGDPETLRLWQILVGESARYFNEVYRLLDVKLTSDDNAGESKYNDLLQPVVDRLVKANLLVESDGAEVVFAPGYHNRDNEPLPLIIRNSVGGFNYATTDLATVIDRIENRGATKILYVVGAPQAQHLAMCWDVCRMAGWVPDNVSIVHVPFGNVLGDDRKMLRSRSGDSVKLSDLLEESVLRGQAAVREKNPELPADEIAQTGRMVGIGAIKYADLSNDRIRDYVFVWERMLSFDGNTGPYLQYAHARIRSIFRRADVDPVSIRATVPTIGEPQERALALRLLAFELAISSTVETHSPHKLCTYLFDLASDFSSFYEACPVLKEGYEATRDSRLALCDLTARVMARGLNLLGIDAPDRM